MAADDTWKQAQRDMARHDKKAHKQRRGQRYNGKPPKQRSDGGWFNCGVIALGLILVPVAGVVAAVKGWS